MQLDQVKKARRNVVIIISLIMVILGVGGNLAGFDFFAVLTVAVAFMAVGYIVDNHYAKQQSAILWKIQRMANGFPK